MDFEKIVNNVKERASDLGELNHTVLFDLEDAGKILLDASGDHLIVTANPENDEAETTLVLSPENMHKLILGELNPMVAFTTGKLKVFGSKGIALKLSSLLDQ